MIRFCEGERVLVSGRSCIIRRIPSFDVIEVQDAETGVWKTVARSDIRPPLRLDEEGVPPGYNSRPTDEQERIRDLRFEVIEPTLNRVCSEELMTSCCAKAVDLGLVDKGGISTIYYWKRRFERTGCNDKNVLLPPLHPTGGRGKHRLNSEVDDLLEAEVDASFLSRSPRKKPTAVFNDVEGAFKKENERRSQKGLPALRTPSKKTVISRIKALDPKRAAEKRFGKKQANERFGIMKGHLQSGSWPWALGQMDHKLLRVFVIDDVTGEVLGLPWLTGIIDTNSRVPPGFVLSLAKPAEVNISLCMAMSMAPKDHWLKMWGMAEEDFPIFGKWGTVQVDNALENEAGGIKYGCWKRHIGLEFRPLRNAQSGGFIESFFRTLDMELKNLPGYWPKGRKEERNLAQASATFTLKGLVKAIATIIIKIYCQRKHSQLQDSPLNVYKRNLAESGIGIPDMLIGDEVRNLILDFMPFEGRTIQEYGVEMFTTYYRSELLEEYIKVGKEVR